LKPKSAISNGNGAAHTLCFNPRNRQVATVPRHRVINGHLARKICKDLEIQYP